MSEEITTDADDAGAGDESVAAADHVELDIDAIVDRFEAKQSASEQSEETEETDDSGESTSDEAADETAAEDEGAGDDDTQDEGNAEEAAPEAGAEAGEESVKDDAKDDAAQDLVWKTDDGEEITVERAEMNFLLKGRSVLAQLGEIGASVKDDPIDAARKFAESIGVTPPLLPDSPLVIQRPEFSDDELSVDVQTRLLAQADGIEEQDLAEMRKDDVNAYLRYEMAAQYVVNQRESSLSSYDAEVERYGSLVQERGKDAQSKAQAALEKQQADDAATWDGLQTAIGKADLKEAGLKSMDEDDKALLEAVAINRMYVKPGETRPTPAEAVQMAHDRLVDFSKKLRADFALAEQTQKIVPVTGTGEREAPGETRQPFNINRSTEDDEAQLDRLIEKFGS